MKAFLKDQQQFMPYNLKDQFYVFNHIGSTYYPALQLTIALSWSFDELKAKLSIVFFYITRSGILFSFMPYFFWHFTCYYFINLFLQELVAEVVKQVYNFLSS